MSSLNLGLSEKDVPTLMAGASQVSSEKHPNDLNRALFSCNQLWNQNMSELEGCSRPSHRTLLCPALCPSHAEAEREDLAEVKQRWRQRPALHSSASTLNAGKGDTASAWVFGFISTNNRKPREGATVTKGTEKNGLQREDLVRFCVRGAEV